MASLKFKCLGFVLALSLCSILPDSGQAADSKGLYSVHGIGSFKCTEIVKVMESDGQEKIAVISWIYGVMSSQNKSEKDTFDVLASNDPPLYVPNLIVNYCRQHPDAILDTSVHTVINVLKPARIKQSADLISLKSDQVSVTISLASLKAIEQQLVKLSFFKGRAQGKYTDELGKAIGLFQATKKLPVTNLPDAQTVYTILLAP